MRDPTGPELRPCHTTYHPICIMVSSPFCTWFLDGKGLTYPVLAAATGFICKACTICSELGRELRRTTNDIHFLWLERMRLIDCAHAWAPSTMSTYKSCIRHLQTFEATYEAVALERLHLSAPPCNAAILLIWAMQDYALTIPLSSLQKPHLHFNTI
eukprot:13385927-Ditylum_brightwellii.AAC.1